MRKTRMLGILLLLTSALCFTVAYSDGSETKTTQTTSYPKPVYYEVVPTPAVPQKAVIRSHSAEEMAPMYYEPSEESRLLGEYFDGVSVSILEHVSDDWVFVDIHTFGAGGYGYMMNEDLAFGIEASEVEKTTIAYIATGTFFLDTHAMGQSGEIGLFYSGEQVELIGLAVSEQSGLDRPLAMDKAKWHVKIGDETGFIYAEESLTKANPQ